MSESAAAITVKVAFEPIQATELRRGSIYAVQLKSPVHDEVFELIARQLRLEGDRLGVEFVLFDEGLSVVLPGPAGPVGATGATGATGAAPAVQPE